MPITYTSTKKPSPEHTLPHIQQLVKRQREFFATGKTQELAFRREQLRLLQRAVRENEQALFEAMHADFSRSEFESFATEVGMVELELALALKKLDKWAKPKQVKETPLNLPASSFVHPCPYGLVLLIGPWNHPINLLLTPLVGAMAAGNCVLLKPSELAPHTTAVLSRLLGGVFPEEYIAVAEGGASLTQLLLTQRYDYIFFTGSSRVGKLVMKAAAEHLTPVTLELGGKNPVIVAEDADLELAARRIVWGKFMNAGQTCVAPDYVLVQEQVKEELVQLMTQCIHDFYGDDPEQSPDYARIINTSQFDRLARYLQQGTVRAGGKTNRDSRYIAPTLLDQVSWEQPVMQEEIFGPILPILPFSSLKEAVELVNAREKPLALYFFSSSKKKKEIVVRCTQFGGGCINDTMSHLANPNLPFGGVGGSGMGSYHGKSTFDLFSHHKSVLHRGTWLDLSFRYPPYGNRLPALRRFFRWL